LEDKLTPDQAADLVQSRPQKKPEGLRGDLMSDNTLADSASNLAAEGQRAARRGLQAAREHLDNVKDQVGERLDDLRDAAKRTGSKVRQSAREQYEARSEQIRAGYQKAQENVGEWSDDLTDYVRENPGRSLLIAAGVGFAVGLLVRGFRRD
jgi:ElaB/YqjD/DUF883 family membrane-anchored ribosome-binding protein